MERLKLELKEAKQRIKSLPEDEMVLNGSENQFKKSIHSLEVAIQCSDISPNVCQKPFTIVLALFGSVVISIVLGHG